MQKLGVVSLIYLTFVPALLISSEQRAFEIRNSDCLGCCIRHARLQLLDSSESFGGVDDGNGAEVHGRPREGRKLLLLLT